MVIKGKARASDRNRNNGKTLHQEGERLKIRIPAADLIFAQETLPEPARELLPTMLAIQKRMRDHIHSYVTGKMYPHWGSSWSLHRQDSGVASINRLTLRTFSDGSPWEPIMVRLRVPLSLRLSKRPRTGLLTLPYELISRIIEAACAVDKGVANACFRTCRSLAAACHGLPVLEETVFNTFRPEYRYETKYCGGCKTWRPRNFDKPKTEKDVQVVKSAKFWLQMALGLRSRMFPQVRQSWMYAVFGVSQTEDVGLAYRALRVDWKEDKPWYKVAEFCIRDEENDAFPRVLDWCPACRAQKLFEDDMLYKTIESEAQRSKTGRVSSFFELAPTQYYRCLRVQHRDALNWLCRLTRRDRDEEPQQVLFEDEKLYGGRRKAEANQKPQRVRCHQKASRLKDQFA